MNALSVDIPVIETERLILREARIGDFDAHAAYAASERSHFVGGPFDRSDAWRNFTSAIGHWVIYGYGFWMLEDKASKSPAGRVGVVKPDGWPEPELAWHVYEGFEGKGIAHEAVIAIRDYAQNTMGFTPLISFIDHDNTRSRALAERLGAEIEREGEILGHPCLVYRHKSGNT